MIKRISVNKLGGISFLEDRKIFIDLNRQISFPGKIFVCSAHSGVTRSLENIANSIIDEDTMISDLREKLYVIKCWHHKMAKRLIEEYSNYIKVFQELIHIEEELAHYVINRHNKFTEKIKDEEVAYILQKGELISSMLFYGFMSNIDNSEFIDARQLVKTKDGKYVDAEVDVDTTMYLMDKFFHNKKWESIVTQGFIATNSIGQNTILRKNGSDVSASLFARSLSQSRPTSLTYWKDVPGVLFELENPKKGIFENMKGQEYLQFCENNHGGPVMPDAIEYLIGTDIPVFVRSFKDLTNSGTRIIC